MESGNDFTVYLGDGRFLRSIDGNTITATAAPSDAAYLSYNEATSLVARFRKRGFPDAHVSDLAGSPMTFDALQNYQRNFATRKDSDNLPKTIQELNRIPVAEQRRRYKQDPRFAAACSSA